MPCNIHQTTSSEQDDHKFGLEDSTHSLTTAPWYRQSLASLKLKLCGWLIRASQWTSGCPYSCNWKMHTHIRIHWTCTGNKISTKHIVNLPLFFTWAKSSWWLLFGKTVHPLLVDETKFSFFHQPLTVAPHDEVSHTNPRRPGPCSREADNETSGRTMATPAYL